MKIVVDEAIPFLDHRFPKEVEVVFLPGERIDSYALKDADALLIRTRTKCNEALLKGSSVKIIVTATIGIDHIDIPYCESRGITVKNAPGCNAPGVAQYVLASLLHSGFDAEKDTLGIVGYGNVGSIVARWANNLGIKTLICDPPRKDAGYLDVEYISLNELLENSDAVSFHVPLSKGGKYPTLNLVGEEELLKMKQGATLVNSSRGGVVKEAALKRFLEEKKLKAIIDVWENEPGIDAGLLELAEIATPHIAGYSAEGKKRATRMALKAINEALGLDIDTKGLECEPLPGLKISKDLILESYNPLLDSNRLRKDLNAFEELRNKYLYRHEPLFKA